MPANGSSMRNKREQHVTCLVRSVRSLNIVTAIVQLLAGATSLTSLFGFLDIPAMLVSAYVVLFALLLLLFECRFQATDAFLQQYCGFLFTYRGLGVFLLMVGILDIGMAGGLFGLVAGATACTNAMIVFAVGCCTPRVTASATSSDLPTTINTVRVPSYGSSASTLVATSATKTTASTELMDVTAVSSTKATESKQSTTQQQHKSKKKARKSSNSLMNTTLNV